MLIGTDEVDETAHRRHKEELRLRRRGIEISADLSRAAYLRKRTFGSIFERRQTYPMVQESGRYSFSRQLLHLVVGQAEQGSHDHGQLVHLEGCELVNQRLAAAWKRTVGIESNYND